MENNNYICSILIISLGLLSSSCNRTVSTSSSTPAKELSSYSLKDFHLKETVKYFDTIEYHVTQTGGSLKSIPAKWPYPRKRYSDKKAFDALTATEKQKLKAVQPIIVNSGYFGISKYGPMMQNSGKIASISNLRYVDQNSNVKSLATKQQALAFMGNIDTPAELQMALWLNDRKPATSYKKVNSGYEFITRYTNDTMGDTYMGRELRCGLHIYQGIIDSKGMLLNYKLISFKSSDPSASTTGCTSAI